MEYYTFRAGCGGLREENPRAFPNARHKVALESRQGTLLTTGLLSEALLTCVCIYMYHSQPNDYFRDALSDELILP